MPGSASYSQRIAIVGPSPVSMVPRTAVSTPATPRSTLKPCLSRNSVSHAAALISWYPSSGLAWIWRDSVSRSPARRSTTGPTRSLTALMVGLPGSIGSAARRDRGHYTPGSKGKTFAELSFPGGGRRLLSSRLCGLGGWRAGCGDGLGDELPSLSAPDGPRRRSHGRRARRQRLRGPSPDRARDAAPGRSRAQHLVGVAGLHVAVGQRERVVALADLAQEVRDRLHADEQRVHGQQDDREAQLAQPREREQRRAAAGRVVVEQRRVERAGHALHLLFVARRLHEEHVGAGLDG